MGFNVMSALRECSQIDAMLFEARRFSRYSIGASQAPRPETRIMRDDSIRKRHLGRLSRLAEARGEVLEVQGFR